MILGALLLAGASPTEAPVDPIAAFRSVCIEGEARFPKGSIVSIKWPRVPKAFRAKIIEANSPSLFLGTGAGGPMLIAVEQGARPDGSKHCQVFSSQMATARLAELGFDIEPEAPIRSDARVQRRVLGRTWNAISRDGYMLRAVTIGKDGMMLRSVILPAGQAARRIADWEMVKDRSGSPEELSAARARLMKEEQSE